MKSLKLTKLAERQLSEKEMQAFTGGTSDPSSVAGKYSAKSWNADGTIREFHCVCGCLYRDQGGSSVSDNFQANDAHGLKTQF